MTRMTSSIKIIEIKIINKLIINLLDTKCLIRDLVKRWSKSGHLMVKMVIKQYMHKYEKLVTILV
jgi:hypothetical protein